MVATRRGAKKAPEVAPAASTTLNAPAKRGRKKAVVEEAAEPTPVAPKATKITVAKRKREAEDDPEAVDQPMTKMPKKTVATKARAAKVQTKAKSMPAAPRRPARGRKVAESAVAVEEPKVLSEAPKPATTRGRKVATTKKTPTVKVEEPVEVAQPGTEDTPKPATQGRKAPVKKAPASKKSQAAADEEVNVEEATVAQPAKPAKPASRARKAAVPKAPVLAPAVTGRAMRDRNVVAPPQESPLKAPARKPTKKAAAVVLATPTLEPVEEPFAQYPGYPTTPARIVAPMTAREAMKELPQYPNTPAHIRAPISTKDALAALPDYPNTPAHITAPISTKAAIAEMAGYPKTPAHIQAPISVQDAFAQMAGYPKTPAHIVAPITSKAAMDELPGYPQSPAHIHVPLSSENALLALPNSPATPALVAAQTPTTDGLNKLPADCSSTPKQTITPTSEPVNSLFESSQMLAHIIWGVTDQEAFEELPAGYPTTPAHISAPITIKQALAELPDYPKTPAHITAPVTTKEAVAELPSYINTPAVANEAALQQEIGASVKEQTPSPLHSATVHDVSYESVDATEYTDDDPMDIDSECYATLTTPKVLQIAPLELVPTLPIPDRASPKKSALRSPQKMNTKTPKKAVTWEEFESEYERSDLLYGGPIQGTTFFVDVASSTGLNQHFLFATLLEDLGAKVVKEWSASISHVLYKDGNIATLEKVLASNGAIKCVNVGWAMDCDIKRTRVDEGPYLVDLSIAKPPSPVPTVAPMPFTPARTPSRYAQPQSTVNKSIPTTPTSSEFDRSMVYEEKENCEIGAYWDYFDKEGGRIAPCTVPHKKSTFLFSRSPMKTPSKPSFLVNTPVKPVVAPKPFSTGKKRSAEFSIPGISTAPKKFRLF